MIGRRWSPRRASVEASSERSTSTWWSRAALLCLALGLVLMHHLVGAHQHSSAAPAAAPSMGPGSVAGHLAHGAGGTMEPDSAPARAEVPASGPPVGHANAAAVHTGTAGSTALLHEHHEGDDRSAVTMLLHMCLAVLAAAAAFLVLVLVTWWWRALPASGDAVHLVVTVVSRAPPVPAKLARLQVLRL